MAEAVLRVELAAHAHATESEERVLRAVMNLVHPDARPRARVERSVIEGHYSNPITRIVVALEGEDAVKTLEYIGSRLDEREKAVLDATLETRYDEREGRLYVRLSKQEAYLGRVRILEGDDVVRLVVVFRGSPGIERVRDLLRRLGVLG